MTQRYDTYKNSGVQWLGEIPGHWGCVPLKRICEMKSGNNLTSLDILDAGDFPVYGANGFRGYYNQFNKEGKYILIGRQGALAGNVHLVDGKFWATDHAIVVTLTSNKVYVDYMSFALISMNLNQYAFDTAAQPGLAVSKIITISAPLPPLSEQHAIVTYLDDKCEKIDKVVEGKQKQIELLAEMKQRIIADAVTRGLNPNVKMKPTNIPWLGDIPGHWERTKVSRLFKQIGSGTTPSSGDSTLYADEGTPWLQSGDFNNNEINSTSKFITDKALDNYCLKLYNPGGVVIAMYGASIGKVGLLNIATTVNQACCVLSNSDHLIQKFTFYVFINEKENLIKKSKGGTQPNISQELIKSHYIPLPPLSEQRAIVTYLDNKCARIDLLVEKLKAEIDAIKEYKQRLISDVVTGQIKVCG